MCYLGAEGFEISSLSLAFLSSNETLDFAFDSLFFSGFLFFGCNFGVERVGVANRLDPDSLGKLLGLDFETDFVDLGLVSTCLLLPLGGSTCFTGLATGLSLLNLENLG